MTLVKISENMRSSRGWIARATSLRGKLWLLWGFIVLLSAFMMVILVGLYQSGSTVQIDAARRTTLSTCESIRSLYAANSVQPGSPSDRLTWGLALLLGFAAVSGGWLAMAISRWSRGISQLEKITTGPSRGPVAAA
jgi:hypothetical protein